MKKISLLLLTVVLLLWGCAKTVESESKSWDSWNQKIIELSAVYPGFSDAMNQEKTRAKNAWDEAQGVSDEEAKIEKMAEANKVFSGGVTGLLDNVDRKITNLQTKMNTALDRAKDQSDVQSVQLANESAQRSINNAQNALRQGANDVESGKVLLSRVETELNASNKNLDVVIKTIKKKQTTNKKAKKNKASKDSKTDEKDAAPANWKCGYCGTQNANKNLECKSCGAPH